MTIRLSMLLEANAKSAKAELAATAKGAEATARALRELKAKSDAASKGASLFDRALAPVSTELGALNAALVSAGSSTTAMTADVHAATTGFTGMGSATRDMVQDAQAAAAALQLERAAFGDLRSSIDPVYRASKQYEAVQEAVQRAVASGAATQAQANRVLDIAEGQYLATGRAQMGMGRTSNIAAGQMGNLVAQFNDIGIMMAAGQNPFQLAIQQGTQITQVIGPMGASGAVKALGGALLGMLNPLSLITIGSIAAGAALVNWLTSAGGGAKNLDDRLDELEGSVQSYAAAARTARTPTRELGDEFGSTAEKARSFFEQGAAFERWSSLTQMQADLDALAKRLQLLDVADLAGLNSDLKGDQFPVLRELEQQFQLTGEEAKRVDAAINALGSSAGPTEAVEAANELNNVLLSIYGSFDKLPERFQAAQGELSRIVEIGGLMVATDEAQARAKAENAAQAERNLATLQQEATLQSVIAEFGANSAEAQILQRNRAWEIYAADQAALGVSKAELEVRRQLYDQANPIAALAGQTAEVRQRDLATANSMLTTLNEQNAIAAATLKFGSDSAEVADLRAGAERRVFEEQVATLGVSEDLKRELLGAFDAAQKLARANMAGGIDLASASARVLAKELGIALGVAQAIARTSNAASLAALNTATAGGPDAANEASRNGETARDLNKPGGILDAFQSFGGVFSGLKPARVSTSGSGGGSGASAAKEEADAVRHLIDRLREEVELQRETDPVQKELIRNREELASATEAERKTIGDLIATREADRLALEQQAEMFGFLRETSAGVFDDLIVKGKSLGDVINNLTAKLLEATLQAALLGEGPLSGLFGGNSGGLIGSVLGVFGFGGDKAPGLPAKAGGGMIYGEGSGTSDDVLMYGSSGEFVVNAAATHRNRALLEALNAGATVPQFASGGMVGGAAPAGGGDAGRGGEQRGMAVTIDLRGAQGDGAIEAAAMKGMNRALAEYDARVLPVSVKRISSDGRRIG